MKIIKHWRIIFVILSLSCNVLAQYNLSVQQIDTLSLTFQKFNVADGLSQGTIYCSFQDSRGFLWFGTQFGLNRFDGYTYKKFLNDPDDSNSISNNYIYSIAEDNRGYLWIGTYNGLNRYEPNTNTFKRFFNSATYKNSISSNSITSVVTDDNGGIWIGTNSGGLNFLSLENQTSERFKFIHCRQELNNSGTLKSNVIRSLLKDSEGRIWIGTDIGLEILENQKRNFFKPVIKVINSDRLLETNIWTIYEDNSGRVLIGTTSGIYMVVEGFEKSYSLTEYFYPSLMNYFESVVSLGEDNSGNLWIGTAGNGVYLWNENQYLLSKVTAKDKLLDLNAITNYSMLFDRSMVLWLGTKTGLLKRSSNNTFFDNYHHVTWDKNSLSDDVVLSLMEDNNKEIWIGTETGLNIFDPVLNDFKSIKLTDNNRQILQCREIKSILQDKAGVIWLGTMWDGLFKIKKEGKNSVNYMASNYWFENSTGGNLFNYAVFKILEDKWGNLWIGTNNGIKIFNKTTNKFISLKTMIAGKNLPPSETVFDICTSPSDSNIIWVGTESEGLFKFVLGNKTNEIYCEAVYKPWDLQNLSTYTISIRTILEDRFNRLWIGTLNSGIYLFKENSTVINYGVKEGLSNNAVTGILEDNLSNIWISTISGLSRFDIQSNEFMNFYTDDGLQGDEFNGGALLKSSSGDIYFGGTDGFTIVHPERVQKNLIAPQINITDIQLFNKSINNLEYIGEKAKSGSLINSDDVLYFSYDQNVLSFEFSAMHFVTPSSNRYAYMLEGVDTAWNYQSNSRKVTYAYLVPGEYLFKVKGSNNNNIWNQEGASVRFIISPPFWSTWWFRTSLVFLICAFLFMIYKKRIRSIEQKKKNLEEQVREKSEAEKRIREMLSEVESLKGRLENENIYLKDEIKLVHNFENIISISDKFNKILSRVEQVSSADTTVLILGESGTGKELLARTIHNLSPRKNRPLIKVDCSTLAANLIESELFGHEKGAFTGAINRRLGRFEIADGGTIFLDEIGELPLELQTKLLRILQDGEFERLGSTMSKKVDVRIISATNRDLEESMRAGKFREDLFYRLNVFPIKLPPLRERKEDIPYLVNHFIAIHSKKAAKKFEVVNGRIMEELIEYDWPGNIRELENIIERAVIVSKSGKLTLESSLLNKKLTQNNNGFGTLEEMEKLHIIKVLDKTDWRVSGDRGAAKILGLKPTTLEYRMKKLGIMRK